jgi:hypothetical protein
MLEAHGGMVWVESPVSESAGCHGSSFFLLVPLEEGHSQTVFPFIQAEPAYTVPGLFDQADDVIIEQS